MVNTKVVDRFLKDYCIGLKFGIPLEGSKRTEVFILLLHNYLNTYFNRRFLVLREFSHRTVSENRFFFNFFKN